MNLRECLSPPSGERSPNLISNSVRRLVSSPSVYLFNCSYQYELVYFYFILCFKSGLIYFVDKTVLALDTGSFFSWLLHPF